MPWSQWARVVDPHEPGPYALIRATSRRDQTGFDLFLYGASDASAGKGIWRLGYREGRPRTLPWDASWSRAVDRPLASYSVATWGGDRLDLVGWDSETNRLLHYWRKPGGWSEQPTDLSPDFATPDDRVALVSQGPGTLDLFVVQERKRPFDQYGPAVVLHRWYEPGYGWSNWKQRPEVFDSLTYPSYAFTATSWSAGRIDLWVGQWVLYSNDRDVWHDYFHRDWGRMASSHATPTPSMIQISSASSAGQLAFAVLDDDGIAVRRWEAGDWTSWERVAAPPEAVRDLTLATMGHDRHHMFVVSRESHVFHSSWRR
jgi:hypothetical protein